MEQIKKESRIRTAFVGLDKAIESLFASVSSHREDLNEVLYPPSPVGTIDGGKEAREAVSPMVDRIRGIEERVREIEILINDLRKRNEL